MDGHRPRHCQDEKDTPRPAPAVRRPTAPAGRPVPTGDLDLAILVGSNVRRLRTQQGYSLSRLADASGVSRAMIGQIELGRSLPSIGVLWKIANALDVRIAAFAEQPAGDATRLMRAAEARLLTSSDGAFWSRALFPERSSLRVEFHQLGIAAGGVECVAAHAEGTIANLVVGSGTIEIDIADKRHWLETGDAILFAADVPHVYRNPGASEAVMYLVLVYRGFPASK